MLILIKKLKFEVIKMSIIYNIIKWELHKSEGNGRKNPLSKYWFKFQEMDQDCTETYYRSDWLTWLVLQITNLNQGIKMPQCEPTAMEVLLYAFMVSKEAKF